MDAIARQPEAGKSKQLWLSQLLLLKVLVLVLYLWIKIFKTIVATVGCNYCFKIKRYKIALQAILKYIT
jgi:hypothetical protein